MGLLKGPLYGSTGSAWDMTLTTWKDLKVFKGKRKKGLTNPSQSVLDHQTAMRQLVAIGQVLKSGLNTAFAQYNSTIGGWAAFMKYNLTTAFDYTDPLIPLDTSTFRPSKGFMTPMPVKIATVADASAKTITVTTDASSLDDTQLSSDIQAIVVFNGSGEVFWHNTDGGLRGNTSTEIITYNTPTGFLTAGDGLNVWVYYYGAPSTATAGTSSDSTLEQITVVA